MLEFIEALPVRAEAKSFALSAIRPIHIIILYFEGFWFVMVSSNTSRAHVSGDRK